MTHKSNRLILFLILTFYIVIPFLSLTNPLFFKNKFIILTIIGILIYILLRLLGFNNGSLGIKSAKAIQSIRDISLVTFILIVIGIILSSFKISRFQPSETLSFYLFYIFISSPIQEFLYRGALTSILQQINFRKSSIILISSILYSLAHLGYKDFITCILTFLIGLLWHKKYLKTKNLAGVTISHAILGVITIFIGIID